MRCRIYFVPQGRSFQAEACVCDPAASAEEDGGGFCFSAPCSDWSTDDIFVGLAILEPLTRGGMVEAVWRVKVLEGSESAAAARSSPPPFEYAVLLEAVGALPLDDD